ncbi:MAG: SpoVG family protein [Clostridia bacterium]|nr:SpoVG family protein [Clostridia bacterium]
MDITQIIIRKRFNAGGLAAVATVIFDDALAVHDIKIVFRHDGTLMAVMPKDEQGRDVVHPLKSSFRSTIEGEISKKLF